MVLLRTFWQNPTRKECCNERRMDELEEYTIKNMEDLNMSVRDLRRTMDAQHAVLLVTLAEAISAIRLLGEGK